MIDISIATTENLQREALRFYKRECRRGKFADTSFNVIINTIDNTLSFKKTIGKNRTSCKVYQLKAFGQVFKMNDALIIYRDEKEKLQGKTISQIDGFII